MKWVHEQSSKPRDRKMLYGVYNNQFPLEFFGHVENPYIFDNPDHQKWPAKIRPTTILRTNFDQLMSEYPKRPFSFFVENLSEDAFNTYTDGLNELINQTLQRKFMQEAQQEIASQGEGKAWALLRASLFPMYFTTLKKFINLKSHRTANTRIWL